MSHFFAHPNLDDSIKGLKVRGRTTLKFTKTGIDVVIGGDGVKDKVDAACVFLHLVGMGGNDDFMGI